MNFKSTELLADCKNKNIGTIRIWNTKSCNLLYAIDVCFSVLLLFCKPDVMIFMQIIM